MQRSGSGGRDHPTKISPAAPRDRWKRETNLKIGQRTESLKRASRGVKKTTLVLTPSYTTRGGQKGAVLAIRNHLQMFNWFPRARGQLCTPHAQQCPVGTQSHMAVW